MSLVSNRKLQYAVDALTEDSGQFERNWLLFLCFDANACRRCSPQCYRSAIGALCQVGSPHWLLNIRRAWALSDLRCYRRTAVTQTIGLRLRLAVWLRKQRRPCTFHFIAFREFCDWLTLWEPLCFPHIKSIVVSVIYTAILDGLVDRQRAGQSVEFREFCIQHLCSWMNIVLLQARVCTRRPSGSSIGAMMAVPPKCGRLVSCFTTWCVVTYLLSTTTRFVRCD